MPLSSTIDMFRDAGQQPTLKYSATNTNLMTMTTPCDNISLELDKMQMMIPSRQQLVKKSSVSIKPKLFKRKDTHNIVRATLDSLDVGARKHSPESPAERGGATG